MDNIKNILIEMGWNENRKIDTTEYENYLKNSEFAELQNAIKFYSEFGEIYDVFNGKFHQAINLNIINYKTFNKIKTTNALSFENMSPVAIFYSSVFGYYRIFVDNNNNFYLSNGEKIASDKWGVFDYAINHFMTEPIPIEDYEILKKAGWYPERCIDTSEFISTTEKTSYGMNENAINFFKEFGNITFFNNANNKITTDIHSKYLFATKKSFGTMGKNNPVPVGKFAEFPIFITEEGEFFLGNHEFIGYNAIQAFHCLINKSYNPY